MDQIDAARAAKRAYQKAWRAKNPDKVKEANERYWIRRAAREATAQTAEAKKEEPTDG